MASFRFLIVSGTLLVLAVGGCVAPDSDVSRSDGTHQQTAFVGKPDLQVRVIGAVFNWKSQYPGPDGKLGPLSPQRRNVTGETLADSIGLDLTHPDSQDDYISTGPLVLPEGRKVELILTSMDVLHVALAPGMGLNLDAKADSETRFRLLPIKRRLSGLPEKRLIEEGHDAWFIDEDGESRRIVFEELPYQLICGTYCSECWYKHTNKIFVCSAEQFEQFLTWSDEMVHLMRDSSAIE